MGGTPRALPPFLPPGPAEPSAAPLLLFDLVRHEDVSGASGTGIVASGCWCPWGDPGTVVLWWRPGVVGVQSVVVYGSLDALLRIHSHTTPDGRPRTEVVFHDAPGQASRLAGALRGLTRRTAAAKVRALVMAARAWLVAFPDDADTPDVAAALESALAHLQPVQETEPASAP